MGEGETQNGRGMSRTGAYCTEVITSQRRKHHTRPVRETWTSVPGGSYIYKVSVECPDAWRGTWHPSIHMPKEAARLFLRVVAVWVERLKDITPEQIDAEGCKEWTYSAMTGEPLPSGPSWFRIAWDRTIKPSDLPAYGWEANPWVWVIMFERISRPPEGKEDGNVYG